jgi:hypothetical protein
MCGNAIEIGRVLVKNDDPLHSPHAVPLPAICRSGIRSGHGHGYPDFNAGESFLCRVCLYHVSGLLRICARQAMAKSLLVWKYQRKFEPYKCTHGMKTFHEWLGISVRQYVYVFLPSQPETGAGETEPSAETTSETFELPIERFLFNKCETLFVAVQNKSW